KIQQENPEIAQLVNSPRRILAFRTFAYIRVGLLLGQLLVDMAPYDGSETWVDALLRDPAHHDAVAREVLTVAEEAAGDPRHALEDEPGPDDEARARFRDFARKQLGTAWRSTGSSIIGVRAPASRPRPRPARRRRGGRRARHGRGDGRRSDRGDGARDQDRGP